MNNLFFINRLWFVCWKFKKPTHRTPYQQNHYQNSRLYSTRVHENHLKAQNIGPQLGRFCGISTFILLHAKPLVVKKLQNLGYQLRPNLGYNFFWVTQKVSSIAIASANCAELPSMENKQFIDSILTTSRTKCHKMLLEQNCSWNVLSFGPKTEIAFAVGRCVIFVSLCLGLGLEIWLGFRAIRFRAVGFLLLFGLLTRLDHSVTHKACSRKHMRHLQLYNFTFWTNI